MDKETKRRVRITVIGILGLVLLIIGISFAAFSTNLAGVQVQTMNTGCLKVDMTDTGSINLANAMPESDESGLSGDPYTYTITNSCTTDAYYIATINVMSGSNLDNLSKVKVALDGDSYLAPTIESNLSAGELLDDSVSGVSRTYKLDEGYLKVGETKTFELRTWIDYDVTSISGSLENKIIVNSTADNDAAISYNRNTAGYYVVSNNTMISKPNYKNIAPSSSESSGVVEVKNNNGITYHFRGNPNNYLTFAGKSYRILSTNSDGSINIVMSEASGDTSNLESVYSSLGLSSYETYIKTNNAFCVENGNSNGIYIARTKVEKNNPTNECESKNTISKIGLLTVDDLMYAGAVNGKTNNDFFLADSKAYKINGSYDENNYYTYSSGTFNKSSSATAAKGVITLDSDTKLEGLGTTAEPFYVSGKYSDTTNSSYSDKTAPIIDKVSVDARWSNTNKAIDIAARDDSTGSGLAGYIVKTENQTPTLTESGWEASTSSKYTTVNLFDNGTYYVYAKDNAGNISEGRKIVISKVDKVAPTCTIRINPNGTTAPYKTLSIITEDTNIDLDGYSWDHTNYTKDVVKVTENGSYTAHLKDLAGNTGSCTAVVTNVTQANEPALDEGMIPVYYDETSETWKKADENNENNNWYNYNDKKWANSVTVTNDTRSKYKSASIGTEIPMDDILTMQVWIPRYKYKVWNYNADGTKTSNPQEIEIVFESETEKTGEITCTDTISGTDGAKSESCKINNIACTDSTCNNKYYTHPAFTFGEEELKGFWIGKFELTGTISRITTKPNLTSITNQRVGDFSTNIMKMNDSGNIYGLSATTDTHMIKNMEWGATAYLSHSKYGTCTSGTCKEVNINNSKRYYTGRSGGNPSADYSTEGTYKYNKTKEEETIMSGGTEIKPTVTNNETPAWTVTDGVYKSATQKVDSSTTNISFNFTAPNNNTYLLFDWSVSSESASYDYLYYTITKNGTALSDTGTSTKIGGTTLGATEAALKYINVSRKLEAGSYILTFTYRKDSSGASGTDTGYIKNIKVLDTPNVETKMTPIGEGKDGPSSSTTHNIYGVYDMSGGAYENVMGNIVKNDGSTMMSGSDSSENSGYTGIVYDKGKYTSYTGTYSYPDAKYYDKYSYGTREFQRIRSKLGDSIKEVLNTSDEGWYYDNSHLANSFDPWFNRGGGYLSGSGVGVFSSNSDSGGAYNGDGVSSRLVITP